jgi:hypothetical protein
MLGSAIRTRRTGGATLHPRLAATIGKPVGCWCFGRAGIVLAIADGEGAHLVVDNYHTHKHPNVNAWLEKHPRVQLHFTPTSASWLNLVEVFFSIITRQAIRRGYQSVRDLVDAISRYIDGWNTRCQPFTWTKTADEILPIQPANELQTQRTRGQIAGRRLA